MQKLNNTTNKHMHATLQGHGLESQSKLRSFILYSSYCGKGFICSPSK